MKDSPNPKLSEIIHALERCLQSRKVSKTDFIKHVRTEDMEQGLLVETSEGEQFQIIVREA